MHNDRIRERNLELLYYIYLVIAIYIAIGLIWGTISPYLGNELFNIPTGIFIPQGEAFLQFTVNVTSVYLAFATVIGLLGALLSIGSRNIFEVLALFLFGMLPRERKYWGVVFDQSNNQPISFIPVRLFAHDGDKPKLITQTVTDSDGRYRLHIEKSEDKKYTIEINYPGYEPVISEVQQYVAIGSYEFVNDIPLVKSENTGTRLLHWFYHYRPRLFAYLFFLIYYSYIGLFIMQLLLTINEPIFINVFTVITLGFTFIWNRRIVRQRLKPVIGKVMDADSRAPVPSALVNLYTNETEKISAVTDDKGVVKLNIPSGMYKTLVSAKGYVLLAKDEQGLQLVKVGKDGYIDKDILLKKQEGVHESEEAGADLINPFQ
jgi:hypothetical protein